MKELKELSFSELFWKGACFGAGFVLAAAIVVFFLAVGGQG